MTRYTHRETGLAFSRRSGSRMVYVTGATYEHRHALVRAGFRWQESHKRYAGTVDDVVALDVPRAWDIPFALGIRTRSTGRGRVTR